jgi:ElaB/YqjD/DUF883 family membrane-anchored ribosome-binding protein
VLRGAMGGMPFAAIAAPHTAHPAPRTAMSSETPFPTSTTETEPSSHSDAAREAPAAARPDGAMPPGAPAQTEDVISRIAQSAHETIDRLVQSAAPHVNRLQENLSGDALHQRADAMREMRDEWAESLRETIRENPLAAVGVALAAGVLIAQLSRTR